VIIEAFQTIEVAADAEVIQKKSRFIASLHPIASIEEVESLLSERRLLHRAANHHCYAYTLGLGVPVERFSDDGEPSGTAGRPLLEVLRRKGLSNVLVMITRYFGGTLLGAGGLVHAYQDAALAAIGCASLLDCQRVIPVTVGCDYTLFGKLAYELTAAGYALYDKAFTDNVDFLLYVDLNDAEDLVQKIADISAGRARVELASYQYVGIRSDKSVVRCLRLPV